MNKERLQLCVSIMGRVEPDRFYAKYFQSFGNVIVREDYAKTYEEFQERKLSACFSGYLALSPEFTSSGGKIDTFGSPVYLKHSGVGAVCRWLECSWSTARALTTSLVVLDRKNVLISELYNKPLDSVSNVDVLNHLIKLGECNVPLC